MAVLLVLAAAAAGPGLTVPPRSRLGDRPARGGIGPGLLSYLLWSGPSSWPLIYFGTGTQAAALLLGAIGAMALHWWPATRDLARRRATAAAAWAGGGWIAWVALQVRGAEAWRAAWGDLSVDLAAAVVVTVLAVRRGAGGRVLSLGPLRWMGSRSYALYLWSYLWSTWLRPEGAVAVPAVLAASCACAEASWRLLELPANNLVRRLTTGEPAPAAAHTLAEAPRAGGPPRDSTSRPRVEEAPAVEARGAPARLEAVSEGGSRR